MGKWLAEEIAQVTLKSVVGELNSGHRMLQT